MSKHTIFLLHGIRTGAEWQETLSSKINKIRGLRAVEGQYGFFDIFRFWIPLPWIRNTVVRKIKKELDYQLKHSDTKYLSVIAHSFGTYAIAKLLQKNRDISIHRLILCGSIVDSDFDWNGLRSQISGASNDNSYFVLNDIGEKDIWPVLAEATTFGYGSSGRTKFTSTCVKNRKFSYAHSDFFQENNDHFENFWLPYLTKGEIRDSPEVITKLPYYVWLIIYIGRVIKFGLLLSFISILLYLIPPHYSMTVKDYFAKFLQQKPTVISISPPALPTPVFTTMSKDTNIDKPKVDENKFFIGSKIFDLSDENTLKRLFGQIFIIGIDENAYAHNQNENDIWRSTLDELGIGGVILNNRNLLNPDTVGTDNPEGIKIAELIEKIAKIKSFKMDNELIPRFVAVDHEGGTVGQLMKRGFASELPSAMGLASLRSKSAIKDAARISATELSGLGINVNLGPVVDLNIEKENRDIRDRSFGDNASDVTTIANLYVIEHEKQNIMSVLKHFPGHGQTVSGFDTPDPPVSRHNPTTVATSIDPFRFLADLAPAIMTSHMSINSLGVDNVTTNKSVANELIRKHELVTFAQGISLRGLAFNGLLITDNLNEPSFTAHRSPHQKCPVNPDDDKNVSEYIERLKNETLAALDAGHDILLFSHVRTKNKNVQWIIRQDDWCARWAITLEEFSDIYRFLIKSIFNDSNEKRRYERIESLRSSIKRIIKAKIKYTYNSSPLTSDQYQALMNNNEECANYLRAGNISFIMPGSSSKSYCFRNVRHNDKVAMFSFLKNKNLDQNSTLSSKYLESFWYRYHNELEKRLNVAFHNNVIVTQLKSDPIESEEQLIENQILKTLDENSDTTHVVFLVDSHHAAWRVVQRFIKKNSELAKNKIDEKYIWSIILRNPSMLRVKYDSYSIDKILNSNIVIFYSTYERGTKYQFDTLMSYDGAEALKTNLPIVIEDFNPVVQSLEKGSGCTNILEFKN